MEGMQRRVGAGGRLGVCPHCGRTAEVALCPVCGVEMIDCENERDSEVYNQYKNAKESKDVDVELFLLIRMEWLDYVFDHYMSEKEPNWTVIDKVCPFCDSGKTRKITFAEKISDFYSNGFKGKKRHSSYHCNDCNRDY